MKLRSQAIATTKSRPTTKVFPCTDTNRHRPSFSEFYSSHFFFFLIIFLLTHSLLFGYTMGLMVLGVEAIGAK